MSARRVARSSYRSILQSRCWIKGERFGLFAVSCLDVPLREKLKDRQHTPKQEKEQDESVPRGGGKRSSMSSIERLLPKKGGETKLRALSRSSKQSKVSISNTTSSLPNKKTKEIPRPHASPGV